MPNLQSSLTAPSPGLLAAIHLVAERPDAPFSSGTATLDDGENSILEALVALTRLFLSPLGQTHRQAVWPLADRVFRGQWETNSEGTDRWMALFAAAKVLGALTTRQLQQFMVAVRDRPQDQR